MNYIKIQDLYVYVGVCIQYYTFFIKERLILQEPPLMEQNLALGPNHKVFEKFVFGANFIFFLKIFFITFLDILDLQDHHIKF